MLDVQVVVKKGPIYDWISMFFASYPFFHWFIVGLIAFCLSFLLILNQRWLDRFPTYGYMGAVLTCVALLDFFTQTIPILTVYLIVLGYVLFRSSKENSYIVTACFATCYSVIALLTSWSILILIEVVSYCLLFVWISWMSNQVKKTHFQLQKLQEKSRFIIEQKNEAYRRLRDYQKELEETYLRDSLTGLYNFHGFQEQVIRMLTRLGQKQMYYVVCIDLTDFRQINMKEGIDAGDRILVQIARQLKKKLPASSRLARYDGDRFAVGIMGDSSVLRRLLETIDQVIASLREEHHLLNYSIGTACYPEEAQSGGELIRLAEERLTIEQRRIKDKEEEHRRHLEKLSAVGQLAAGLAHEIRNPLTSIRGFVQISATESEAVKKWESIILPEIDRINDLLKQFLKLSEVRPVQVSSFNLDQLMNDVFSLLKPKSFLMGHELKQLPPKEPVELEADSEQLKQVLINLIQNGLEALDEQGVVEIEWCKIQERAYIRIEDTGYGIKPEHMSRIFEPFFSTKEEGTGMGLSICHRIITEHGGQIYVTSHPGRGTAFHIYLPLRQKNRLSMNKQTRNYLREVDKNNGNERLGIAVESVFGHRIQGAVK